jgi:hypothetical protein
VLLSGYEKCCCTGNEVPLYGYEVLRYGLLPSGVLCAGLRHCRNLDAVVGGCRTRRVWIVRMCELCPFVTLCCSVSSPTRAIRLERVALLLAVGLWMQFSCTQSAATAVMPAPIRRCRSADAGSATDAGSTADAGSATDAGSTADARSTSGPSGGGVGHDDSSG